MISKLRFFLNIFLKRKISEEIVLFTKKKQNKQTNPEKKKISLNYKI